MAIEESKVIEYRLKLPLSVDEYKIGQLYGVSEISKLETGGGEGIEVIVNENFEGEIALKGDGVIYKGRYTHKVIHLQSKVPSFVRVLAPNGSLEMHERSWNAYPYTFTAYSNDYMKENFYIIIESFHDDGKTLLDNATNLTDNQLKKRQIVDLDLVTTPIPPRDYNENEDPTKFQSTKTGRGKLDENWSSNHQPIMQVYKSYRYVFKWFALQPKMEAMLQKFFTRLLTVSFRRVFTWIDEWIEMSIEDIRELEEKTKEELDNMRSSGEKRGMMEM